MRRISEDSDSGKLPSAGSYLDNDSKMQYDNDTLIMCHEKILQASEILTNGGEADGF